MFSAWGIGSRRKPRLDFALSQEKAVRRCAIRLRVSVPHSSDFPAGNRLRLASKKPVRTRTSASNVMHRPRCYAGRPENKAGHLMRDIPKLRIRVSPPASGVSCQSKRAEVVKGRKRRSKAMYRNASIVNAAAVVAACFTVSALAADLPRSGTYSAHYAWTFSGQIQELGADRSVYVGVLPGVVFNDAGEGFLHKVRMDCTIHNDVDQGRANANGTCAATDADGDEAFLEWKCAGAMPACPGDFQWTGGTGKYKGISGSNKFQGNFIGTTGAGWSDWSGEYKLP